MDLFFDDLKALHDAGTGAQGDIVIKPVIDPSIPDCFEATPAGLPHDDVFDRCATRHEKAEYNIRVMRQYPFRRGLEMHRRKWTMALAKAILMSY
jgi:hypothetical protein